MDETKTLKPFSRSESFDSLSWSCKYDVTSPYEPRPTEDIMSFEYAFIEVKNLDKSLEVVVGNEGLFLYGYVFYCTPITWAHVSAMEYFLKTIYVWTRLVPSGLVLLVTCDIGGPVPPLVRGGLDSHLLLSIRGSSTKAKTVDIVLYIFRFFISPDWFCSRIGTTELGIIEIDLSKLNCLSGNEKKYW